MSEMLEPQPGESIYDPTCGSGGMLLSCVAHPRRQGKEWRNVRLYGQERNLMTSSIARMNCFLHGIEDFRIERGDTLSEPKFVQGDRLQRFDLVLANPPYSIKQWERGAFAADPWGRNLYGAPRQGRADYAFWQHILCSLAPKTGRCARERAQSFLINNHIERIVKAYQRFKDEPGFARVATLEEIRINDGKLSIPLYVVPSATNGQEEAGVRKTGELDLSANLGMWLESLNRPCRLTAASPAFYSLRPNSEWDKLSLFNRREWKTVQFGDVVKNVNE